MKTTQRGIVPPRPIEMRTCKCGCGNEFQPYRKDQIYLNRQHGNLGYNHLIRKTKDAEKIKQVKVLAKNDRILEKHFQANIRKDNTAIVYFDILRADGYNFSAHVGVTQDEGKEYFFTFHYIIRILPNEPRRVKIFKR